MSLLLPDDLRLLEAFVTLIVFSVLFLVLVWVVVAVHLIILHLVVHLLLLSRGSSRVLRYLVYLKDSLLLSNSLFRVVSLRWSSIRAYERSRVLCVGFFDGVVCHGVHDELELVRSHLVKAVLLLQKLRAELSDLLTLVFLVLWWRGCRGRLKHLLLLSLNHASEFFIPLFLLMQLLFLFGQICQFETFLSYKFVLFLFLLV